MARLKVEGHVGLVRDKISNAIVNTNKSDYELYMMRNKTREMQRDSLADAIKEINSLKQELFEIKSMLKKRDS
tara:strand:- start:1449 stop:1667 length:219 start_codon:yes stop_codon:yes gene_type:complete